MDGRLTVKFRGDARDEATASLGQPSGRNALAASVVLATHIVLRQWGSRQKN